MKKWRGVAIGALVSVSACAQGGADGDPSQARTSAVIANRNLDVLFMVDNSSSMRLSQMNLASNFSNFIDPLKALPGGLPNIHIAVVSSDMGAGTGNITGCSTTGDNGVFHFAPTGTCTATTLQSGATYISNVNGTANYTAADITTVFSCIAALGDTGCGFEHQFASVLRALGADGMPAPTENQGFLRSDALLAIIMVTNEDDCSARAGTNLYDTTSSILLRSDLGPPSNFRCNEFGHVCDGQRPPREAPNEDVSASVMLNNCTSSECDGSLVPVAEFVARLKALKAAPNSEIVVGAITGPATPYTVTWKNPSVADTSCNAASCPWPQIAHSCTSADGSFADPSVRISDWVKAFGTNGITSSICDASFAPALQQIAMRIGTLLAAGGGTGGPAGSIPNCAVTGIGGQGGTGGTGGDTGTGGTGGTGAGNSTGADAATGEGGSSGGCGCQTGGAAPTLFGLGVAGGVTALLARRRRRDRASGTPSRG
jgi:MYXO-CTERM domain-containing protein